MKVTFRQSGGFAGLVRGCELDTAGLAREEGKRLRRMVKGLPDSAPEESEPGGARDTLSYEITVEEPGLLRRLRFEESAVPKEAARLIDFLASRSSPRKP